MPENRPIPIPWGQRWRDCRTQALPLAVFAVAVGAIAYLWQNEGVAPTLSGEVYGVFSEVTAPESGIITELFVEPFSHVEAGQLIGRIEVAPSKRLKSALAVLEAESQLMREGGMDPVMEQQRIALSWEGLRSDLIEARADLAKLRIQERQAEADFRRFRQLSEQDQVALSEFELAKATYEAFAAEAVEREHLVKHLEATLEKAPKFGENGEMDASRALEATLVMQEMRIQELIAELEPIELYAPTSGTVTQLLRHVGQYVISGTPLVNIRARKPEYIIGYLKIPATVEPHEGMAVKVGLRGSRRGAGDARVLRVGTQYEALGLAFQHPMFIREERALPIMISVPSDMMLRPGEIVDLQLLDQRL